MLMDRGNDGVKRTEVLGNEKLRTPESFPEAQNVCSPASTEKKEPSLIIDFTSYSITCLSNHDDHSKLHHQSVNNAHDDHVDVQDEQPQTNHHDNEQEKEIANKDEVIDLIESDDEPIITQSINFSSPAPRRSNAPAAKKKKESSGKKGKKKGPTKALLASAINGNLIVNQPPIAKEKRRRTKKKAPSSSSYVPLAFSQNKRDDYYWYDWP